MGLRDTGFPFSRNRYVWTRQSGAINYLAARATSPDFTVACTLFAVTFTTFVNATDVPSSGQVHFYQVRANAPFAGSWGADSGGVERVVVCD